MATEALSTLETHLATMMINREMQAAAIATTVESASLNKAGWHSHKMNVPSNNTSSEKTQAQERKEDAFHRSKSHLVVPRTVTRLAF